MIYIVTYIKLLSIYEYLGYIYVCLSRYIYLKYIPSGSPICVVFLASTQMCIHHNYDFSSWSCRK